MEEGVSRGRRRCLTELPQKVKGVPWSVTGSLGRSSSTDLFMMTDLTFPLGGLRPSPKLNFCPHPPNQFLPQLSPPRQ